MITISPYILVAHDPLPRMRAAYGQELRLPLRSAVPAPSRAVGADERQCYFWATHSGAEIDLIVQHRGRLRGFEVKRTSSPAITRSIRSAVTDLELHSLDVIHAGEETFPLAKGIRAVAAVRMLEDL